MIKRPSFYSERHRLAVVPAIRLSQVDNAYLRKPKRLLQCPKMTACLGHQAIWKVPVVAQLTSYPRSKEQGANAESQACGLFHFRAESPFALASEIPPKLLARCNGCLHVAKVRQKKTGYAITHNFGEISSVKKRIVFGRQKHSQRPATRTVVQHVTRALVDLVKIRAFFPVNFDINKMPVH